MTVVDPSGGQELTLLCSVGDRVGDGHMAALGFRYAEVADT